MSEYISLGGTCAVVNHIRNNLSVSAKSYPFDWAKTSIKQLINVLSEDFAAFDELEIKKFSENHPLINENDDTVSPISDNDDKGSLVLTNKFGITFAHEIIRKCQVETFKARLGARVKAFQNLQSLADGGVIVTFVRLEVGKLKKGYNEDVEELLLLLSKYVSTFRLILIVHKDSERHVSSLTCNTDSLLGKSLRKTNPDSLLGKSLGTKILVKTFEKFDEDWRYPELTDIFLELNDLIINN
jgi:hypothetical protein